MDKMPMNTPVKALKPLSPTLEPGGKKLGWEKLKKACTDFEALFMAQMLKLMGQTIPQGGFFGKGVGNGTYPGLMDQELSQNCPKAKG